MSMRTRLLPGCWKETSPDPLALYYTHPTLVVFLAQLGINQDVNETPIFASGHGHYAAIIGAAGMVIGNGLISFPLSRLGYAMADRRGHSGWAMFFYWTTVASLGNFIDYVPVRTFTSEGDMGSIQRGFGWSPWLVLLVLGLPTAMVLIYFLLRIEPASILQLFPDDRPKRALMIFVSAGCSLASMERPGCLRVAQPLTTFRRCRSTLCFPSLL